MLARNRRGRRYRLAIDEEGPRRKRTRGARNRREAVRPIIAAAGEQPHARAVATDHHPIAVVFDLVQPIGAARLLLGFFAGPKSRRLFGAGNFLDLCILFSRLFIGRLFSQSKCP